MREKANISYVDSRGNIYDLMVDGLRRINKANFHEYSWTADSTESRFGEVVRAWKKEAARYAVTIYFEGNNREKLLNDFHESLEYDIVNDEPGTLIWNEYSINCYGISSKTYPAEESVNTYTANDVTFYCPKPWWTKVTSYYSFGSNDMRIQDVYIRTSDPLSFEDEDGVQISPRVGKLYLCKTEGNYYEHEFIWNGEVYEDITQDFIKAYRPSYDYQYDYALNYETFQVVYNSNALGSNYILIIYGPASNPYITIKNDDGTETNIAIDTDIPKNARLVINSIDKTVLKYLLNGDVENCFGQRNLEAGYLWNRIPFGNNRLDWDGAFDFDLHLVEERSEPKWLLG